MKEQLARNTNDKKDLRYTWICSGCDTFFRTEDDKRPEECPDCKVPSHYIYRYYQF